MVFGGGWWFQFVNYCTFQCASNTRNDDHTCQFRSLFGLGETTTSTIRPRSSHPSNHRTSRLGEIPRCFDLCWETYWNTGAITFRESNLKNWKWTIEIGDVPIKTPFSSGIFQPAMFDDTRGYPQPGHLPIWSIQCTWCPNSLHKKRSVHVALQGVVKTLQYLA